MTKPNTDGLIKKPAKLKNELLDMPETAPLSAADDVLPMQGKTLQTLKNSEGVDVGFTTKGGSRALNPGINMTKEGLTHTLDRHTINDITRWAGKSKFSNLSDVPDLIKQAT